MFTGLSTLIRQELKAAIKPEHVHPTTTEESLLTSQGIGYFTDTQLRAYQGTFRWGYSVWGVDTIIGVKYPDEL